MRVPRRAHRGAEGAGPADHHALPEEHARRAVRAAEAVLDRQDGRFFLEQCFCRFGGGGDMHRFRRQDHEITGADFFGLISGVNAHGAIAGRAFDAQTFLAHGVDVLAPGVDRPDLVAGGGEEARVHRAHRARSDDHNLHKSGTDHVFVRGARKTWSVPDFMSGYFEHPGGAHAAANAHRHHHVLRTAAFALDERMAGEARAAHAVGMAERDRPAVDIQLVIGDADALAAVEHLDGERFVQLPEIDVLHFPAGLLEELRHREYRADAHFLRVAARGGEAAENTERAQAAPRRFLAAHDHRGGCAVGELARVARRDAAAFDRGLDLRYAFVGGVGPDAFVLGDGDFSQCLVAGVLVEHLHLGGDRHDLVLELAFGARFRRAVLALHAVLVLLLARNLVAARDVLGGLQHRPVGLGLVAMKPLVLEVVLVHLVLHHRDRLDAAGHEHLAFAGEHALACERDRLQARGAEAVHRHAGNAHRAARAHGYLARNVPA